MFQGAYREKSLLLFVGRHYTGILTSHVVTIMPVLRRALVAWGTPAFVPALKSEIEALPAGSLPLDDATTQGGRVGGEPVTVTVLQTEDAGEAIHARLGVFFTEVVGGCSCGDEAWPLQAHCELQVEIAKADAAARFTLLPDR